MKRFWKFIKCKTTDLNGVACLKVDGKLINEPKLKAEALNRQFQSVFTNETEFITQSPRRAPSMPNIHITTSGVWSCSLTSTQAKHLDQTVSAQGIEELSCVLADPLARLFRKSLSSGHILNDCKHANVTHVFKKGQKYFSSNYRPISLACIAYKLMEHICSSIMSHAEQYNIVYPLHYGFRPSRSCETQLLEMVNNTVNSMQLGFQTDVCVLDFSKKLSTRLDINA